MSHSEQTLTQIPLKRIDGSEAALNDYQGKVLLIVNVASQCGLTPQYTGLEKIYEQYHERGFEVLGFPANEFGAQEPGSNEEIQNFCQKNYGVKFSMFEKIVVKGEGIHPLYQALTQSQPQAEDFGDQSFAENLAKYGIKQDQPGAVLWNFEKFLLGRDGSVIGRFAPGVSPEDPKLIAAIEAALA